MVMTAEEIRKAQRRSPFKPFTICLSDQRQFSVPHPDFLWLIPGGRTLVVADQQGAADWIDLIHVTSLKVEGTDDV